MVSPKITLYKSLATGNIEVTVHDTVYAAPGQVYIVPEGGLSLEDPLKQYKDRIKELENRLAYAERAKKHILNNLLWVHRARGK